MFVRAWTQQRLLRLAGVASIVVALIAMAGDEILQYTPQGYASLAYYHTLPLWRMFTGQLLGVLTIPLCLIGYWCVCHALKLGGSKWTRLFFWLIAYGLVMGAISHDSLSLAFELIREGSGFGLTSVMNYVQNYANVPGALFLFCYLAFSIWYCIAVLSKRSLYPRWMALCNPFLLSLLIALLHEANVLPIILNILWPAWLSVAHVIFFMLSTLVLWRVQPPAEQAEGVQPFVPAVQEI